MSEEQIPKWAKYADRVIDLDKLLHAPGAPLFMGLDLAAPRSDRTVIGRMWYGYDRPAKRRFGRFLQRIRRRFGFEVERMHYEPIAERDFYSEQ